MKPKLFIAGAIFISIVMFRISYAQKLNSLLFCDLTLANIEALAEGEETTQKKGLQTSKEVVKYYYNELGQLERTEKYTVYCCSAGTLDCSNPSCEDKQ